MGGSGSVRVELTRFRSDNAANGLERSEEHVQGTSAPDMIGSQALHLDT